jgi:hypothetical protein
MATKSRIMPVCKFCRTECESHRNPRDDWRCSNCRRWQREYFCNDCGSWTSVAAVENHRANRQRHEPDADAP